MITIIRTRGAVKTIRGTEEDAFAALKQIVESMASRNLDDGVLYKRVTSREHTLAEYIEILSGFGVTVEFFDDTDELD